MKYNLKKLNSLTPFIVGALIAVVLWQSFDAPEATTAITYQNRIHCGLLHNGKQVAKLYAPIEQCEMQLHIEDACDYYSLEKGLNFFDFGSQETGRIKLIKC